MDLASRPPASGLGYGPVPLMLHPDVQSVSLKFPIGFVPSIVSMLLRRTGGLVRCQWL
jgi:hypothetical protein